MRKEKILIVVDMQLDFIDGPLGNPEAQAIVPKVVEKIKNWNGLIAITQDTHDKNYLNTAEGKKLPIEHCIEKTAGWSLCSEVERALKDKETLGVFLKETFGSIPLMETLNSTMVLTTPNSFSSNFQKILPSEIHLVGLDTDICVISNALLAKAYFPEVPIIVDASCCAGSTPENHRAALQIMKCCQIDVINEEENKYDLN